MLRANAIRTGRQGGRARSRNLSPETRSQIARKAAHGKWAKRDGQPTHDEFIENLVDKLRAADPDLATFVEIVNRIPLKDQESIFKMLPLEKRTLVCRATEEVTCKPA